MSSKYINPYTDFGFKKLFGEEANKALLVDFLNSVLPEKHRIRVLKFRNVENLPQGNFDRRAMFDIFCESENGEKFIVEMQKAKQHYFRDRSLFYSTFPIHEQARTGDWDFELNAIYFIGILDFRYDETEERQKFLRDITLKDQDGEEFYEKLHFIFFQMPLFTKTESELESRRDKWCYFLKNLESFENIPSIFKEPIFEQAFASAELAKMSPNELNSYEQQLMIYRDNFAMLKTARDEGEAVGIEKGLQEGKHLGRQVEKHEIARKLKATGMERSSIAQITGLSEDEIERL